VKWHLPHSAAAEHRGRTSKCQIKDHKVAYDYEKIVPVRFSTDKNGVLEKTAIFFEVLQEYSSGARGERIMLGNVTLNLAEYVGASESDGEEGVCRRYLMQDSKINSTLKVYTKSRILKYQHALTTPDQRLHEVYRGRQELCSVGAIAGV
jgi:hypothetical protein